MALGNVLRIGWPAVAITMAAVAFVIGAIVMLRTMPPRTIVMATGAPGGAYFDFGERYRAALAGRLRAQLKDAEAADARVIDADTQPARTGTTPAA